ncbi:MAG: hypothetical protein EOP36_17310 [Rubrivivax sp.]|nr:MAG: hypothetical protein EOP36_17310 [Rubrivivax sp.]
MPHPPLSKDTSPNAAKRWQAMQDPGMTLAKARSSLLALGPWWDMICKRCGVDPTDPVINTVQKPPAKSINAAVADYDASLDRAVVDHAIFAYKVKAGWRMEQKYKDALSALFEQLDVLRPRPLPDVPGRARAVIPGGTIDAINQMARYAVTNAPTFSNVPPPKLMSQVMLRCWSTGESKDQKRLDAIGMGSQFGKIIGTCGVDKLNAARQQVVEGRGAVCTSFACTAASMLAEGNVSGIYRVELISGPNHCFCLVNRAISDKDVVVEGSAGAKQIPGAAFWGDQVIIVDAWAGALGNAVFYGTPGEFPKALQIYFTQKLLQHFDSAH